MSFDADTFLILMKSNLCGFLFVACVLGVTFKKSYVIKISSCFLNEFIASVLKFKSLIHFELTFLCGIRHSFICGYPAFLLFFC